MLLNLAEAFGRVLYLWTKNACGMLVAVARDQQKLKRHTFLGKYNTRSQMISQHRSHLPPLPPSPSQRKQLCYNPFLFPRNRSKYDMHNSYGYHGYLPIWHVRLLLESISTIITNLSTNYTLYKVTASQHQFKSKSIRWVMSGPVPSSSVSINWQWVTVSHVTITRWTNTTNYCKIIFHAGLQ